MKTLHTKAIQGKTNREFGKRTNDCNLTFSNIPLLVSAKTFEVYQFEALGNISMSKKSIFPY